MIIYPATNGLRQYGPMKFGNNKRNQNLILGEVDGMDKEDIGIIEDYTERASI